MLGGFAARMRILGMVVEGFDSVEVVLEARRAPMSRPSELRVVGLPEASVKEGIYRARAAAWPLVGKLVLQAAEGVLINLAPADLKKTGRSLDLPLAVVYAGLFLGLDMDADQAPIFMGEVGLGGEVRSVPGVLAAALLAQSKGRSGLVVPRCDLPEARVVRELPLFGVDTVADALAILRGEGTADSGERGFCVGASAEGVPDLADVRGQWQAKRALEIAAAGGHNLLMEGPPGSGKTMLARRIPSILPELGDAEALEVAVVQSAARSFHVQTLRQPPFRAPHHTASPAGLVGGGMPIRPGEFSRAHHGVLFLDEFPEFDRRALEVLRQPLEERVVHLVRAGQARQFPADFLCVAAMNPCPCGFAGLGQGRCRCTPKQVQAYRGRLSGPLLDRFDLRLVLQPVEAGALFSGGDGESSAVVAERVRRARERQAQRAPPGQPFLNARRSDQEIRRLNQYGAAERSLLVRLMTQCELSARAARRLERVARTIADLSGVDAVGCETLMEALSFRMGGTASPSSRPERAALP